MAYGGYQFVFLMHVFNQVHHGRMSSHHVGGITTRYDKAIEISRINICCRDICLAFGSGFAAKDLGSPGAHHHDFRTLFL